MRSSERIAVLRLDAGDWAMFEFLRSERSREFLEVNVRREQTPTFTPTPRVTCVVEEGRLRALGLGHRVRRSGDFEWLVRVERLTTVDPSLSIEAICSFAGAQQRWIRDTLFGGGVFGEVGGSLFLEAIATLQPGITAAIRALRGAAASAAEPGAGGERQIYLREQRDAVALGLEIAGLDSRAILPVPNMAMASALPFLSELDEGLATSEAALIRHDQSRFGEWGRIDGQVHDVVEFHEGADSSRRVAVLYADKEGPERVTGTDLIYFTSHSPGYVLVQYKRMRRVDAQKYGGQWLYRPDAQLRREIDRMKALRRQSGTAALSDWRLSPEPFYVKLVEGSLTRQKYKRLVPGMYFPLGLFELLLESPGVRGRHGGVGIGWHNAGRYLTNTDFLGLVQGGWIGSQADQTETITHAINASIGVGRGVVAVRDDSGSRSRGRRTRPDRRSGV
jgi:hypothetical protein